MEDIPTSEGPDPSQFPAYSSGVAESLQSPSPQMDPTPYSDGDIGRDTLEEELRSELKKERKKRWLMSSDIPIVRVFVSLLCSFILFHGPKVVVISYVGL